MQVPFSFGVVKGKTKSQKGLENLLRYTPKPFKGFLESAWQAKQYVESGDVSKAAIVMADYVDASAISICETVRSPGFTIMLYKATIYSAKIAGAMYGKLVALAADELVDYLEKEIEALKEVEQVERAYKKKKSGEEDLEHNLAIYDDLSYNMGEIPVAT